MKSLFKYLLLSFISLFTAYLFSGCSKSGTNEDQPVITSIFPETAKGGATITVYGENLLTDTVNFEVSINNKIANVILSTNDSMQFIVPPKAGSGKVILTANNRKYEGPEFTYEYEAVVTTLAGSGSVGSTDGIGTSASFNCPWGIAVDKNDDLYIADSYNRLIRKINRSTNVVSTISIPTLVKDSFFYSPYNIAIDTTSESIYVTDFNQHLMKIRSDGDMSVIFSTTMPLAGVGVGHDEKIYLTNNTTGEIIQLDTMGQNSQVFSQNLITPRNIVFDKDYNMYVAGYGIYKVQSTGDYIQLVNPPSLFHGWEIAIDTTGVFYEADHFSNLIRKIERDGTITVIAGSGNAIDQDGIGLNASFDGPTGIVIDREGNLYVTTYNFDTHTGNKVRKITFQ